MAEYGSITGFSQLAGDSRHCQEGRSGTVEITEVKVMLRREDKLKAFVNITFDDEFVVRGLKIIGGKGGYFVSMPSRRRPDGSHQDICHPINSNVRAHIERRVLDAYEDTLAKRVAVQQNGWGA